MSSFTIPHTAVWESTTKCNLHCTHCGLGCTRIPRSNELTTAQAQEALRKLGAFGISNLVISGGEFTVRRDWKDLLAIALSLFLNVRIITNGRMGGSMAKALGAMPNQNRLIISVSVDGAREAHDHRRGKGSFVLADTVLATVPTFKTVITTFTRENFADRAKILELCLRRQIAIWSVQVGLPAGRLPKKDFLGMRLLRELADFIWCAQTVGRDHGLEVVADDCYGYHHPMRVSRPWLGCPAGKELITMLANGDITGCPTMYNNTTIGNITNNPLDHEFSMRFKEVSAKPSSCKQCGLCPGGCHAVDQLFHRQFCF